MQKNTSNNSRGFGSSFQRPHSAGLYRRMGGGRITYNSRINSSCSGTTPSMVANLHRQLADATREKADALAEAEVLREKMRYVDCRLRTVLTGGY